MKYKILFVILLGVSAALAGCIINGSSSQQDVQPVIAVQAKHPAVSEQEKLMPCFECHKDATPDIYEQWFNSGHGIGNVKCYQCHGTYENLKTVPDMSGCGVCHGGELQRNASGKKCWQCHPAHTFTVHK